MNGEYVCPEEKEDYLFFDVDGETQIEICFEMRPRFVYANEHVRADSGRKAVEYGPLVMCAESCENGMELSGVEILSLEGALTERTPEGIRIRVPARRLRTGGALYSYLPPEKETFMLTLIPYYGWANRGENDLQVWFL